MFSYSMREPSSPSMAWISPGRMGTMEPACTGCRTKLVLTVPLPRFTYTISIWSCQCGLTRAKSCGMVQRYVLYAKPGTSCTPVSRYCSYLAKSIGRMPPFFSPCARAASAALAPRRAVRSGNGCVLETRQSFHVMMLV